MSYILDALRRAERERHVGQAPTLQSLTHAGLPVSASRTPRWLAPLLVALMLLLLAASAWMLWPRPAPSPAPQPPPVVSRASPQQRAAPLPAAVAAAEAASVIDENVMVESLDDVAAPFSAARSTSAPASHHETPAEANPSDAPAIQAPPPSPSLSAPPASPPPTATPGLPRGLRDMPVDYRKHFPAVTLDVHVYNADPARRWIMVGGRRYNEGQTLDTGPRIVGIVPEGAIMDYANERVLLAR